MPPEQPPHEHVHGPGCAHDHDHAHDHAHEHAHEHAPLRPYVRDEPKIGRNDPCTCGSGKKYKKCHGAA